MDPKTKFLLSSEEEKLKELSLLLLQYQDGKLEKKRRAKKKLLQIIQWMK